MSIINDTGVLAISTRLQRLSERLRKDGHQIYEANGIDFEPKWFPIIYTLHVKPLLSVVEIAGEIGYTHPSTISLLKELEHARFVSSKKDKADERKRLIRLTVKGRKMVEEMKPVWELMTSALTELVTTKHQLLLAINEVEAALDRQSFLQRVKALMP